MTLADARGKILFMIREDYKSANGGRYLGAYLNWTHDKVVFETTLHGNTGETAPIKVNDLYNIKNGSSDGVSKYAAIDECIAYTYGATDVTRWCMNYVSCYDTAHCAYRASACSGAVGDYDYCANLYNRYTADKLNRKDFRGNAGIVLMDFAGAGNATMTYGQTYSNMRVYGDDLVKARHRRQQQMGPAAQPNNRLRPSGPHIFRSPSETPLPPQKTSRLRRSREVRTHKH